MRSTAPSPVAAIAAGSSVRRRLDAPGRMPTARPIPKTISASASTVVLRKLRLNWRSAIVLAGIPNRRRIQAPTPMLASEPPGTTIPPPSCVHAACVLILTPRGSVAAQPEPASDDRRSWSPTTADHVDWSAGVVPTAIAVPYGWPTLLRSRGWWTETPFSAHLTLASRSETYAANCRSESAHHGGPLPDESPPSGPGRPGPPRPGPDPWSSSPSRPGGRRL